MLENGRQLSPDTTSPERQGADESLGNRADLCICLKATSKLVQS